MVDQDSIGIKSIEVGARILKVLLEEPLLSIAALSQHTGMSPSKVHRYLVSFIRTELVVQNTETKLYGLGPLALQLGIAAISRSDDLTRAIALQREIRDSVDETVVLSVWGSGGPTIVHVAESTQPIMMTMKIGGHLPLLDTASGLVFAAYMPDVTTRPLIERDIEHFEANSKEPLVDLLARIRHERLFAKTGHLQPGVSAFAAPLLTLHGSLFAVITIVAREAQDDEGSLSALLAERARIFNKWMLPPEIGSPHG